MWKLIGRMFINIVFVTVIYLVSYSNRDSNALLQVNHLRQFFLNDRNSTYSFSKIISINDYWKWLQNSFISNIRLQSWYNGDRAENMTDYIDNKANRLIGWATMRQLRLRLNASCKIPSIMRPLIDSCQGSYSIFNDERRSFAPGWVLATNVSYSTSIENAFIYRSSAELDSYIYLGDHGTYGSGGYVYDFRGNMNDLQDNLTVLRQLSWIDAESRAVMIQLNLYNPNVQFFVSVTLLIEITITGELFPSARIEPIQMYNQFNNFSSIFYLIIAFIYIIFIICFTLIEIYSVFKLKKQYFRQMRSYIEWIIIGFSWAGVAIYIYRYHEANRIGNHFRHTNGFQYINLQFATYINDILTFLLGFLCFFGTIRLLQLFETYPRVNIFSKTLARAFKDIVSFSLIFALIFIAFMTLFYLLFVSKILSCSSLLQTSGMLFQMLLLKFNVMDIQNADAFLGPFAFSLFIYFVVFICCTMFISIINENFRYVRQQMKDTKNVYPGAISFIIRDVKKRAGFEIITDEHLQEQKGHIMRSQSKDPIAQLPDKVDELLIALNKLFVSYPKSEIISISQCIETSSRSSFNPQRTRTKKRRVIY